MSLKASFSAFSLASAPLLIQNTVSRPESHELRQAGGGALADCQGHSIGLKRHLPRLALERGQPARMTVAQARNRVPAVEIQDLAAVARMQPDALAMRHFDGILREHLRQMARQGCASSEVVAMSCRMRMRFRSSRARGR